MTKGYTDVRACIEQGQDGERKYCCAFFLNSDNRVDDWMCFGRMLKICDAKFNGEDWNLLSGPLSQLCNYASFLFLISFLFFFFFFWCKTPLICTKRDTQLVQENATMHLACKLFCVQRWVSVFLDLICCSACVFSPAFSLISRDECCPGWFGVLPASGVHAKRWVTSFLAFCKWKTN